MDDGAGMERLVLPRGHEVLESHEAFRAAAAFRDNEDLIPVLISQARARLDFGKGGGFVPVGGAGDLTQLHAISPGGVQIGIVHGFLPAQDADGLTTGGLREASGGDKVIAVSPAIGQEGRFAFLLGPPQPARHFPPFVPGNDGMNQVVALQVDFALGQDEALQRRCPEQNSGRFTVLHGDDGPWRRH